MATLSPWFKCGSGLPVRRFLESWWRTPDKLEERHTEEFRRGQPRRQHNCPPGHNLSISSDGFRTRICSRKAGGEGPPPSTSGSPDWPRRLRVDPDLQTQVPGGLSSVTLSPNIMQASSKPEPVHQEQRHQVQSACEERQCPR